MAIHQQRRDALAAQLRRLGGAAALITRPASVHYLTGLRSDPHERFLGLFLTGDQAALVLPAMEVPKAQRTHGDCRGYPDQEGPAEHLRTLLATATGPLAVEKDHLTLDRADLLPSLGAGELTDAAPTVRDLRSRKDAEEVRCLREAARMVDEVVAHAIASLRAGMTELDLLAVIEAKAKQLGSPSMAFATMVLSGAKSADPHGATGSDPIREGEYLLLDLGVEYGGYFSDITRTFHVGEASPRHREIYEVVLRAQTAAIDAARPGVPIGELDRIARRIITDAGYGEYFTHRLGHGLGLEIHEYPSLTSNVTEPLQPGLCFTVEPGVYIPGFGGVRIEDDLIITADGCEVLTKTPKSWESGAVGLG